MATDPLQPKDPCDDGTNRAIGYMPDHPPVNPTGMQAAIAFLIVLFAGAGIFFALRDLMQAFLVSQLIVIGLAGANIVMLLVNSWRSATAATEYAARVAAARQQMTEDRQRGLL